MTKLVKQQNSVGVVKVNLSELKNISKNDAVLYNSNLNKYLSDNVSEKGFVMPQKTTGEVTQLAPSAKDGTIWYDEDTHELKTKKNGSIVTISTT